MSAGYASRLKHYPNKGKCGLPELKETTRALSSKIKRLTQMIQEAKGAVVILTGAGISTNAGIPDFRGPNGIWTKEQKESMVDKKNKRPRIEEKSSTPATGDNEPIDFSKACPSLTHRIVTFMCLKGIVRFCVTQNVDGLHRRSGLSRSFHSVLHGCVFTEKCEKCNAEHFRDYEVGGMSFQKTGRKCEVCGGDLRDTLLDWEDPLPEGDHDRAMSQCEEADLTICLGTSLRIEPAGSLPTLSNKFVVVNKQETPYDKKAALVIHSDVDYVLEEVLARLDLKDWETDYTPPPVSLLSTSFDRLQEER